MMKFESKQIVEIIGVSSIVISLAFLAYQTSQSNRIAIATAEIEINTIYAGRNEVWISNQPLRSAYYKAIEDGGIDDLSADEDGLLFRYVVISFNAFFSREAAFRNGVLSEESFNKVFNDLDAMLASPAYRELLRKFVGRYPAAHENPLITYVKEYFKRVD